MRQVVCSFALAAAVLCGVSVSAIRAGVDSAAGASSVSPARAARTGNVVARFRASASFAEAVGAMAAAHSEATASTAGSRLVLLRPAAGESVDDAVARLRADAAVEYAEPDVVVSAIASVTPNDGYYAGYQWNLPQLNLPAAWGTTTGSATVIIAVVDTGVDGTHPDLSGKITTGANAGYNFVAGNTNTADDNSHGTFVAGIAAANSNNGTGMAGVCWSCKIMPVKVLDASGSGSSFNVASGIDWAVAHGANVINLSLGSPGGIAALQTAVDNAWNAGAVVVAASGNDNGPVLFPAAYANAIAVGSNNPSGARSSFSNLGPELDVMAPGSGTEGAPGEFTNDILSTLCTCSTFAGGYGTGHGTSFAAPHVAGVVGLMIAAGMTDKATITSKLKSTATDIGVAGFDSSTGYGRVNAAAAVGGTDTSGPTANITSPANGASVTGLLNIDASATDPSGVQKVRFWVDGTYLSYDMTAPYSKAWDTSLFKAGAHTLKIEALDMLNNSTIKTISVTVVGGDVTAPTASITAPADGATVSGTSVNLAANATDAGGVQKVRFWADSTYLSYDTSAPYTRTWNTSSFTNGTHTLKIEALDWANNSTIRTMTVTVANVDPVPPSVSISTPASGAIVSGIVTFSASASDAVGVQKVRFWVDNVYLSFDMTAPYTKAWDTTVYANGPHVLKVEALDLANNSSVQTTNVMVSN